MEECIWKNVPKIYAIGDIHGNYESLIELLKDFKIIDDNLKWIAKDSHLVQVGDFIDRGRDSKKVIEFFMKIEKEASKFGGKVHVLLGDHEGMNILGDLRYVSTDEFLSYADEEEKEEWEKRLISYLQRKRKKIKDNSLVRFSNERYKEAWTKLNPLGLKGHRNLFSPQGDYGKWLISLNKVININGIIFVHAGISKDLSLKPIEEINKIKCDTLVSDYKSPLWWRDLIIGDEKSLEDDLNSILSNLNADTIVVGHTPTEGHITPRFNGKVIGIDCSILKGYKSMLLIEDKNFYALYNGKKVKIERGNDFIFENFLENLLKINSANIGIYKSLSNCYLKDKKYKEAINCYEKIKEIKPNLRISADSEIADIYSNYIDKKKGDKLYQEILSYYEENIKIKRYDPVFLNEFALFLAKRKINLPYALELSQKANNLSPMNEEFIDTLGYIYFLMDDLKKARNCFEKILKICGDKTLPIYRYHLALVYQKLGNVKKAKGEIDKVKMIDITLINNINPM